MAKTTRRHVKPVASVIQFQGRDQIKSVTIAGEKSDLLDLETDGKGNITLFPMSDPSKQDLLTAGNLIILEENVISVNMEKISNQEIDTILI